MPETLPYDLAGRYRLDRRVGSGGSGHVYEATDLLLVRTVAIKRPARGERDTRELGDALVLAEGRMLARLEHPSIVQLHDCGFDDERSPYLVLELLPQTLDHLLRASGPLSAEETIGLLLPIAGALAYAHEQGVLHRDLKPENIAVVPRGSAWAGKLLDFGIAHSVATPTNPDEVVGTPGYIAPEQACGQAGGPISEVWALGMLAFQCLSGRLPYQASTRHELLERCAREDPPGLATFVPTIPDALARAIDRAIEREPARRYGSMRAFARGLIAAAAQANLRVPEDPDPVGLPDAPRWLSEYRSRTDRVSPVLVCEAASQPAPRPASASFQRRTRRTSLAVGTLLVSLGWSAWYFADPLPPSPARAPVLAPPEAWRSDDESTVREPLAGPVQLLAPEGSRRLHGADDHDTVANARTTDPNEEPLPASRRTVRVNTSGGEAAQDAKPDDAAPRLTVKRDWEW